MFCLYLFKLLPSIVYTLLYALKPLLEHARLFNLAYTLKVLQKCLYCKIRGVKSHPTKLWLNKREHKEVPRIQVRTVLWLFQLLDPFRLQKLLCSGWHVCRCMAVMQQQTTTPSSGASFGNCSKHTRQTVLHIPSSSDGALGNQWNGCQMTSARDENSNHLFGNCVTVEKFLGGLFPTGIHCWDCCFV